MKSKKKMTTTAFAVALAVLLLIGGGTFAYLQSTTGDVKNSFKTNQVTVSLDETTGSDYNIIPGTTEKKDPTVTVNATVDAYVYVEVTDTTKGLVGYEIADGWTKLDGYDNVYYREVTGSAAEQSFPVLKDNQVTYDAALENSDMMENGQLKTGVELTFKARVIQKDGFVDAKNAYKVNVISQEYENKEIVFVDASTKSLKKTIESNLGTGNAVVLNTNLNSKNTSARNILSVSNGMGVLDLNGQTITGYTSRYAGYLYAIGASGTGTELTIMGRGLVDGGKNCAQNVAVRANSGAKIVIKDGTYTTGMDYNKNYNSVILANGGTIEIEGGFFYNYQNYNGWVLNCQDNVAGSAIIVKGGTFVNFDPSNNTSDGEGTNYVAAGYTVKSETKDNGDIWYTVVKGN